MMINNGPGAFVALFTDQTLDFGFQPGQQGGTSTPPPPTGFECQVSGPSVQDLFYVASGVSYTWFPLHRRTK